ncbi:uncharacterized protein LOC118347963 [Juglans regia]|uniref:Uncharacterized protein LOC118347963 n=1 Tax=Juglans regia TaxID=51240 RepID=A0A6P9EPR9_JUGRE|nr:uncharacterized protein LOC118347963 [Juglans regia]
MSGGLMVLWKKEDQVELLNYSQWHINLWVKGRRGEDDWLLTGFYGNPDASKREKSWELLKELKPQEGIAWCVVGDFNEIISQDEKVGGRERSEGQMTRFREGLEWAGLYDMGWIGNKFTWSNGHEDHTFIKERLDRGVANQRWMCRFMERMVEILGTQVSDHKALVLTVGGLAEGF